MDISFEKEINKDNALLLCEWSNEKGKKFQEQWMGDGVSYHLLIIKKSFLVYGGHGIWNHYISSRTVVTFQNAVFYIGAYKLAVIGKNFSFAQWQKDQNCQSRKDEDGRKPFIKSIFHNI